MPIHPLHRERLERALEAHETALQYTDKPLSPTRTKVHRVLLELGRDDDILKLIDDFVDSPQLADEIRYDGYSVLSARGIKLPETVTMKVVNGNGKDPQPILRFQFTVRSLTVLADWDPKSGACTRAAVAGDGASAA
ncbi:hypothetical protein F7R91_20150 [Streptomyces luteolifulvus]|uniref:Uncharacterized protein n=1 Tax=Streptomyces luteolifulvus TaxID=2615112 RepID=A0A6H9V103_9ACTN|nr:hypothetical protein [Streptomyces luteolifulvus]KAB1144990.1 hypothetical protein F7R91_20150 [Streptomyces luteolifulvus]